MTAINVKSGSHMKNKYTILVLLLLLNSSYLFSRESASWIYNDSLKNGEQLVYIDSDHVYAYGKPRIYEPFARFGGDLLKLSDRSFAQDNRWNLGLITASTVLMVAYDQQLIDAAQEFGRRIDLDGENNLMTYVSVAEYPIFRGPTDLSSGLYYIGDGWTHISLAAGFLTYGLTADDNRAIQTASQLGEGMLTCGFTTQLIKHITGRESPFKSTANGGVWRPFADQVKYHKNVPKYDAYPSGHLCTAMMTVTVIAENYPDHKYIWPLGWTMMSLLSYQMMNNGVHWISDYPLSIGMGYMLGKIAVEQGRRNISKTADNLEMNRNWYEKFSWQPTVDFSGALGLSLTYDMTNL